MLSAHARSHCVVWFSAGVVSRRVSPRPGEAPVSGMNVVITGVSSIRIIGTGQKIGHRISALGVSSHQNAANGIFTTNARPSSVFVIVCAFQARL